MKKILLFLIGTFLFSSTVISQVKPFRFGFLAGGNIAWLSADADNYESDGASLGFSWGFVSDITLTENYFVKTGFKVNYLNGKLTYPFQKIIEPDTVPTTGQLSRKYQLRNLEIPVTIKMRTNKFDNFAFYGDIGFGVSFSLKSKAKDTFAFDDQTSESKDNDVSDDVKFAKASLIVGAGLEYFIDNSTTLILELRFNNGLTNILKGYNNVYPEIKQKAFMYYVEMNVGIMF